MATTSTDANRAYKKLFTGALAPGTELLGLLVDAAKERIGGDPDQVGIVLFTSTEVPEGVDAPTEQDGVPIRYEVFEMSGVLTVSVIDMGAIRSAMSEDPFAKTDTVAALFEMLISGGPSEFETPAWLKNLPGYTDRTDQNLIQAWRDAAIEVGMAGDAVFRKKCDCGTHDPGLTWQQLFEGLNDSMSATYHTYVTNAREESRAGNVDPIENVKAYVRHTFGASNITA